MWCSYTMALRNSLLPSLSTVDMCSPPFCKVFKVFKDAWADGKTDPEMHRHFHKWGLSGIGGHLDTVQSSTTYFLGELIPKYLFFFYHLIWFLLSFETNLNWTNPAIFKQSLLCDQIFWMIICLLVYYLTIPDGCFPDTLDSFNFM